MWRLCYATGLVPIRLNALGWVSVTASGVVLTHRVISSNARKHFDKNAYIKKKKKHEWHTCRKNVIYFFTLRHNVEESFDRKSFTSGTSLFIWWRRRIECKVRGIKNNQKPGLIIVHFCTGWVLLNPNILLIINPKPNHNFSYPKLKKIPKYSISNSTRTRSESKLSDISI